MGLQLDTSDMIAPASPDHPRPTGRSRASSPRAGPRHRTPDCLTHANGSPPLQVDNACCRDRASTTRDRSVRCPSVCNRLDAEPSEAESQQQCRRQEQWRAPRFDGAVALHGQGHRCGQGSTDGQLDDAEDQ